MKKSRHGSVKNFDGAKDAGKSRRSFPPAKPSPGGSGSGKSHSSPKHPARTPNESRPARPQTQVRSEPLARPPRPPRAHHGARHGESKTFWLWGLHAIEAALGNPKRRCVRLMASSRGLERIEKTATTRGVRIETTEDDRLDRMLPKGSVHQGLALEVEPLASQTLEKVLAKKQSGRLLVVLDQVNDPHNLGAVLRSAAAFGADGVIVQERHSPPLSGVTAKSASGALEHVPVIEVVNISRTLDALGQDGFLRLGFDEDGAFSLAAEPLARDVVLVFGAEGEGLRRLTRENCDRLLRLPTAASFSSLNVSNAVAVALYEVIRQRHKS